MTAPVSFSLDDRGALIASLVCLSPHFTVGSFHLVCPIDWLRMWSLSQIVDVLSVLSPSLPDRTAASSFSAWLVALIHSSFQILTKVTNSATQWLLDRPAFFKRRFELRLGSRSFCSRRLNLSKNTPVRRPSDRLVHNVIVIIKSIEYITIIWTFANWFSEQGRCISVKRQEPSLRKRPYW